MKLTFLLMIAFILQLRAEGYAQRITLSEKNASLKHVFRELRKQSGYDFLYSSEMLKEAKSVDVQFTNAPLEDVLKKCFASQPLTYVINKKTVVVMRKTSTVIMKQGILNIAGKVTDEKGLPLPGASVKVKGLSRGTITNANGEFELRGVDEGAVLVVSFLGFVTQEVNVGRSLINVTLKPDMQGLTEVVVVGFGTQKKISVTAAISSVSNKQLLQTPVANISNALVGRLPGLVALQTSGDPGQDGSLLLIRGKSTLNNASPLVLIDGVERPLNSISPYEVETLSILKDASATAVYGVRGANGVILVTTKRGVEGKSAVSLTLNTSMQEITRIPDYLNSYQFAQLYNEALANEGAPPKYTDEQLTGYRDHTDPYLYPDVDYFKEFLKPFAPQQTLNANVSGGTKIAKYFVSGTYLNQGGLYKHTDLKDFNGDLKYSRYNFRSNIDLNINKDLRLSVDLGTRAETRNSPYSGTSTANTARLMSLLVRTPPLNSPLLNPDGSFGAGAITDNTLAEFSYQGFTKDYTNLMEGTFTGNYKMDKWIKGLSAKGLVAFTNNYRQKTSRRRGTSQYDFYTRYPILGKDAQGNYQYGGSVGGGAEVPILSYLEEIVGDQTYRTAYFEGGLNYSTSFGRNNITGLLLANRSRKTQNQSQYDYPFSYQGVVGRLTYNWDYRYMLELNMGYNGSEQFPPGNQYGFFPSASAAWVVSSEGFMKKIKAIDYLKLRASFGQVGNDLYINNTSRFLYLDNPYATSAGYAFGLTNNFNPGGISEGVFGNPDVQWEKANKYNLGLESQFFDKKLSFNLDVFYEKRSNILVRPSTLPVTVGLGLPIVNLGIVDNRGYDLELGYNDKVGKFNYFIKTNLSFARNKVIFNDETGQPNPWLARTGQSLDKNWGLETAGFFNTQEEIDSWAKTSYDPGPLRKLQPGDFRYVDQDKNGIIDNNDMVPVRHPSNPEYVLGFTLGGQFKGFDFNTMLQGAANASMSIFYESSYDFFNGGKVMDIHLGRWTPENKQNATYPRLSSSPTRSMHNYITSDYWVKDASYLRIKQAEIGYTFSKNALEKLHVKGLRVYMNGSNLHTWDKIKYLDPENRDARTWFYPQQKVWSAGVNITL